MLQDELPVKKISQALLQDHRTWIPMDYFIQSLKNRNNFKHEREIFNPERWETNPLEQYRACAPVQKK